MTTRYPILGGSGSVVLEGSPKPGFAYSGAHALGLFGSSARMSPRFERHLERVTTFGEQMRRERSLGLYAGTVRVNVEGDQSSERRPVTYDLEF